MADKVYKTKEIANQLKITQGTVSRLILEGSLQGFKVGKQWRITQKALNEFIEKSTIGGM